MASKVTVTCPLGADVFHLLALEGGEQLSTLFHYDLHLLTARPNLKLTDLVGQDMTVSFDADGESTRYLHGYVTDVIASSGQGRFAGYRVTVKPWLWFLSRTANCRIFQNQTVPDIVKQVLKERGIPELTDSLTENYPTCEYVVQYRESDFNFISRLMEREGIYYFFRHDNGKHTLVLADGYGAHEATPNWEKIPYYPPNPNMRRERDHIDEWSFTQSMQSAHFVLNDYDFVNPSADLHAKVLAGGEHENDEYEVYDYPGDYTKASDGEQYVGVRYEEIRAQAKLVHGAGNVRKLCAGALFTLREHPRDDQNCEYLVTRAHLDMSFGDFESSGAPSGAPFLRCTFSALESSRPFRAPRVTPRPVVHGPQTAKVVGKSGEEIWTDEYGRVKVQFHWDRLGKSNESSSCWVRVSQTWAGASWGAMHVPRIGQEVVVSFLEGDPDRPLITGRVYNGSNKPPFELPAKGMVSGVKSDSTPGGGGYNEISLDDTKGSEKITVHGQFDMNSVIEHDKTLTVHNNRTSTIDVDDTESVGNNQTQTVGVNQSNTIGANQTNAIGANQDTTVGSSHTLTVALNSAETIGIAKALTIGGAYQVSVGAAMNETVAGLKAEEVGAAKSVNVAANSSENIGGSKSVGVGKNVSVSAGQKVSITAGKEVEIGAGADLLVGGKKKGVINVANELTLKVGGAKITLKKNGDIVISGKKIQIDASGDIIAKGGNIKQN